MLSERTQNVKHSCAQKLTLQNREVENSRKQNLRGNKDNMNIGAKLHSVKDPSLKINYLFLKEK